MADNPRHRQTQNLLLMKKILRAEGSPFTVVLDCVEQGAGGVVREVLGGAKVCKRLVYCVLDDYGFLLGFRSIVSVDVHVIPENRSKMNLKFLCF